MSVVFLDQVEIFASGIVPETESFSSVMDVRGISAIQLIVRYVGGGFAGLQIRPQFSFNSVGLDGSGDEIPVDIQSNEWIDGTIGEFDGTNNLTNFYNDISQIAGSSGVISRKLIAYDNPGAVAARFAVVGDTLTGDDLGTVEIDAVRINSHGLLRRLH